MSDLPVNAVDLGVAGALLISALLAFSRGLVREVLSIGAWVAAVAATIYGFPHLNPLVRTYIKSSLLADAVTGVTIFIITLVVFAALSHALARNIRGSGFGALDRSLGFLFGLARGAVVVCLAYMLYAWAVPKPDDQSDIVKQAKTLPLITQGASVLYDLLPKDALDKGAAAATKAKDQLKEKATQEMLQTITPPQPQPGQPDAAKPDPGYNAGQRKDLDRLIQGNQ